MPDQPDDESLAPLCPSCGNGYLRPQWRDPPVYLSDAEADDYWSAIDSGAVAPHFYECDCEWCSYKVEA